MLDNKVLDSGSQGHFLFILPSTPQVPIKSSPAHLPQLAQSLDTQTTLQRHPCSYFVVDALSPGISPCRRRAPTLCKACLKKSTSKVLFANSCFSLMICFRRINSRDRPGLVSSSWSRQL